MLKSLILKPILKFSFFVCILLTCFSGCVRLTGGAGVWKQSAEDAAPTTHQVGFDTNQALPQNDPPQVTV